MQIQEQYMEQARKLHQACPVADAHLDLAGELLLHVNNGEREALRRHYLDELREGGFNLVVSSVYLENEYLPEMGLRKVMDQIGVLLEELDQNEEFLLVKNVRDLDRALEEDRIGVLLYLEGMDFVGTDFHLLRTLWEAGVRGASLTWSRRNALASGCCVASKRIPVPGGLTDEGVEAVRRMEDLGMFLDISHLNDDGFEDVCAVASKPFAATHSNSRTIYFNYRNLTDEQMKKLAAQRGVIGLNGCRFLVGKGQGEEALDWLCSHLEYMAGLVGADKVGYGFDFCDAYDDARDGGTQKKNHNDCLVSHCHVPELTAALLQRGMSEEDVKGVIGGNWIRYFRQVLPK